MERYEILCFDHSRNKVLECTTRSWREASKIYKDAIKRGCYSSVTLRIEKRTHGYALKSWSLDDGEVILNIR